MVLGQHVPPAGLAALQQAEEQTMRLTSSMSPPGRSPEAMPVGVCVLVSWLEDGLMQSVALEQNLSETASVCPWKTAAGHALVHAWWRDCFCGHAL